MVKENLRHSKPTVTFNVTIPAGTHCSQLNICFSVTVLDKCGD